MLFGRDGELRLIDFDDSGYGFFAYDLVIPLAALEYTSGTRANEHFARCREALFDGYQTMKPLDPVDVELVGWMLGARKLSLLNWLESRADNPRMVKVYPRFLSDALDHFRNGIPAE